MHKIIILLLVIFIFGVNNCMKNNLSDSEFFRFNNIDNLNKEIEKQGWAFNNKIFDGKRITGLVLNNIKIRNVEFKVCVIEKFHLKNLSLIGVRFFKTKAHDIEFSNVIFDDCEFSYSEFERCIFTNCKFQNCRMIEKNGMNSSKFTNCLFEKLYLNTGCLCEDDFVNCKFVKCNMEKEGCFDNSKMDNIEFINNIMNSTTIGDKATRKHLRFRDCTMNGFSIGGQIEDMIVEKCKLKNFGIYQAQQVENIRITDCEITGESFQINIKMPSSKLNDIKIINCKNIGEIGFVQSIISNFEFINCSGNFVFIETKITDNVLFKNCTLTGLDFREAKIKGVTLENVEISNYIAIEKAVIEGLKLKNVTYINNTLKPLTIFPKDVKYISGDQFPIEGFIIKELKDVK